ncbi:unnamed protein product [Mytilus coruscus]|uniref:Uncharacterized protein n=1 Tax=Mytilus coruscus TaxID=42192 RepID=A0A6J8DG44_MYTCO|nr:unnamed protein product [Mytilus coruscus]
MRSEGSDVSRKKDFCYDRNFQHGRRKETKPLDIEKGENAFEHSEYASSVDNRSVVDLKGVKSTERFQRYLGQLAARMINKDIDPMSRTGAFHRMVRRRATMYDTSLDLKDYANSVMSLPLTSEGVFGSQFDEKLKEKTERNKHFAECLPDLKMSAFSSSQENGKLETSNQPKTSQPVSSEAAIQNGHFDKSPKFSKTSRLGFVSRYEGCIFTCTHSQILSKIPTLLNTGKTVSVCSTMIRPTSSSKGFYKDCNSNSQSFNNSECKASHISRRLVTCQLANVGVHCQSRIIILDPSSVDNIHRSTFQFVSPTSQILTKLEISIQNLMTGHNTARDYLVVLGLIASCIEMIPNVLLFIRHIQLHLLHYWKPSSKDLLCEIPFTLHLKNQWQITSPVVSQYNNNHRCFQNRFWGPHERSDFSGQMDRNPTIVTHQSFRVRTCGKWQSKTK